ncbi:MAG TPA: HIT family protein [Phycisphaerales bacterium]|nr:HIT family protein [Phycisphaerales bacterium]
MPTIFTRIIKGEIPSHKVYEDDLVYAFLDINPLSRGHTLVVPKEEKVTLDQLGDEAAAALGRVMPRLCRAVMKATGATAYNILQNNGTLAHQAVPHVHFHIIPRFDEPDRSGLTIDWEPYKLEGSEGAALAKSIAAAL